MLALLLVDLALLGGGFGLGWLLDGVAESRPLLTLFGFLVGLASAVIYSWGRLRRSAGTPNS
jgi:F0F1-type ATP synthase assembly protein I